MAGGVLVGPGQQEWYCGRYGQRALFVILSANESSVYHLLLLSISFPNMIMIKKHELASLVPAHSLEP